jgi:hypothetical protein
MCVRFSRWVGDVCVLFSTKSRSYLWLRRQRSAHQPIHALERDSTLDRQYPGGRPEFHVAQLSKYNRSLCMLIRYHNLPCKRINSAEKIVLIACNQTEQIPNANFFLSHGQYLTMCIVQVIGINVVRDTLSRVAD